jgi:putative integral membrane protein (TIGR02587 family)
MNDETGQHGGVRESSTTETVAETATALLRAVIGGLLVGLPLLWTQEMWDHGATLGPLRLMAALLGGFVIVVGFNALSGFRRDRTFLEVLIDAVEGFGLSIVIATALLLLLGRIGPGVAIDTAAGRIALETIPVAFGTALATSVLGGGDQDRTAIPPLAMLFVAAGGALYFALNVAPTDEVRILGAEAGPWTLLLAIAASLAVGVATEWVLRHRGGEDDGLGGPIAETVCVYAVALVVSYLLLAILGLLDGLGLQAMLGEVIMLGIVATFGAAAGRILVVGTTR